MSRVGLALVFIIIVAVLLIGVPFWSIFESDSVRGGAPIRHPGPDGFCWVEAAPNEYRFINGVFEFFRKQKTFETVHIIKLPVGGAISVSYPGYPQQDIVCLLPTPTPPLLSDVQQPPPVIVQPTLPPQPTTEVIGQVPVQQQLLPTAVQPTMVPVDLSVPAAQQVQSQPTEIVGEELTTRDSEGNCLETVAPTIFHPSQSSGYNVSGHDEYGNLKLKISVGGYIFVFQRGILVCR